MIGQTVSHYRILEKIGSGGMGVVYKAEDTRIHLPVAIKFLPTDLTRDEPAKQRFIREAQAAFALDHPNICNIHEIDETADGQLFICMSYYAGESLRQRLERGPVPAEEAIHIAQSVAAGLARAHGGGIVHRDIKPGNIFITNQGEVKILDFGLAKLAGRSRMTRTGTSPGTVAYMSPEQATGGEVDARSDIFSLGGVLYELLTGHAPFEADREAAVLYQIVNQDPVPIRQHCPDCPVGLQRVVDKALQKDPDARYQTATGFQEDLARILQGVKPAARRRHWTGARAWPRSRIAIGGAIVVLALVAIALHPALKRLWSPIPDPLGEPHVAVLPFENIAGDASSQAFCDGMMQTLTSKLSQLERFHGSLWVVPASDVRKQGITSAQEARSAFGVTLVVTGSIQTIGNDLRLTMNLVSMASGTPRQLDSFVMDVRLIDIAMLQDHMVSELAEMMKVDIPPGAAQAVAAGNTSFSEAFGSYVRGVGYLQRYGDLANVDLAIDAFKRATQEDPTYALAYAGLGEAYWWKYHLTKDKSWLAPAIDNCNRAAELNDGLAPVQVSLGLVHNGTGGYEEAVSHFQRAIDLDAGNVDAYRGLAAAYQNLGKFEEAEAAFRTAIATKSDFWAPHNDLGKFYLRRGRYDDAVREFQEVATLTPDNVWAYINLGATYYYMERWPEASDMFRKAIDIKPMSAAFSNLASIEYIQGDYAGSARTYLKALAIDNGKYSTWANLGNAYYWSPGERDKAAEAYRRARELAEQQRNVNPRDASVLAALASYDVMLGDGDAARAHMQQALAIAPDDIYIDYWAAHTYEQLGERDKALQWMEKAIDAGYPIAEIERDPFMEKMRQDSQFKQLTEEHKE